MRNLFAIDGDGERPRAFSLIPYGAMENVIFWARCAAFARDTSSPLRLLAWTILALWIVIAACAAVFSVIAVGAAFAHDNTLKQSLLFLVVAAVVALYPVQWVRRALRRKQRTGRAVKLTEDDALVLRRAWRRWRNEQYGQPLAKKRNTVAALGLAAAVWLAVAHFAPGQFFLACLWICWSGFVTSMMFVAPDEEIKG